MKKVKNGELIKMIRSGDYENVAFEIMKAMESTGFVTASPIDVWRYLKRYTIKKQERFIVLFLDNKNTVIDHSVVSKGTLNETIVHPREVFREAIVKSCASIIVAHNHPSGSCVPSREDFDVTKRLIEAGKVLGIRVVDHVIISQKAYLSMKEDGQVSFD